MRKPSRVMIMRELEEALWRMIQPQLDSQGFTSESEQKIMREEIHTFVEGEAKSLRIEELADALYSPGQTMALFLEHLHSKGMAGDPIVSRSEVR